MQTQDEAAGTGAGAVGIARLGYVGNQVLSDSDEHAMDIDTELRIEQDITNEPRAGCAKDEAWEVNGEAGSQHESVPGGEAESSGSSEASTTGRGGGGHVDDEASASNEDDGNNEPTALPQPPPILPSAHIPGTLFRDPPGKWFKRRDEDGAGPQQQMLQHANSAGHAFKAACDYWAPDKSSGTGHKTVKGYASYPDAGSFLNIALLPSDVRFLYELIPEGAACKLHLDIEWQGHGGCDGDDAGRRMQDLLLLLAKDIEAKLGIVPRFIVLDGSRPAGDGGSKHSYHVICPNVVFASNTGGMKAFVNDFIKANEVHQALWFFYDKGNRKCVIDQTIYTKNRCFRTELSSKLTDKTATCLRRVRLSQDGAWHDVAGLTSNDYLEALVTHIDDSFDRCSIIPDPTPASQPDGSGGKKRCLGPSSSSGGRGQAGPRDSVVVARLQELVDAKGCAGCVVVGPLSNSMGTLGCSGGFQCKNNGERECLVTPGAVHSNNNCFLTIDSSGTVKYTCHSSECRSVGAVEIGRLGNAAPNGKSGDVDRQGPSGGRVSYDKDAMVNNDEDAMVDDAKLRIEQDIDTEQSAPRDKVESSHSEASNTGKGGGAAEKRKRKHTDDEASASDKDKGDDDDSEGGGSNSDSGGDDGYDDDSEGDDDDDDDDSEGGDGGGDSSEGDDDSEGSDGGGNSSEGNDNDDNSEDGNGGNDDDRGDGDDDDDDDDDMEEGDMRDAEVLTRVSFPCYNRGSKIDDLLITEVESLVTFFEDPDQHRCRVLTATASDFHCNRAGRHAEGRRSQTDPIKTIHLEPPVDKGDERPIDYRLELYVGRLKRSNMRVGKILGVCQAIRDACANTMTTCIPRP